jgi:hypothetical protein
MKTMLIFVLSITAACFAQDAKIMIVERADSQRLAKAYREYKDAQKHWEEVKTEIADSYTHENGPGHPALPGWEKVQFSADFRAIVPDFSQYAASSSRTYYCPAYYYPPYWYNNGISIPATTTNNGTTEILTGSALGQTPSSVTIQGSIGSVPLPDGVNADLIVKEK